MVDENERAKGQKYYAASGFDVSPDNKILAFGEDFISRRQYTIKFKDLANGAFLKDEIPNTNGGIVWANDNKTVFYEVKDATLRSYKVFRHIIGTDVSKDVEIFHEKDETFRSFVFKTKSEKFIVIGSFATLSQNTDMWMPARQMHPLPYFNPASTNWNIILNTSTTNGLSAQTSMAQKTSK